MPSPTAALHHCASPSASTPQSGHPSHPHPGQQASLTTRLLAAPSLSPIAPSTTTVFDTSPPPAPRQTSLTRIHTPPRTHLQPSLRPFDRQHTICPPSSRSLLPPIPDLPHSTGPHPPSRANASFAHTRSSTAQSSPGRRSSTPNLSHVRSYLPGIPPPLLPTSSPAPKSMCQSFNCQVRRPRAQRPPPSPRRLACTTAFRG